MSKSLSLTGSLEESNSTLVKCQDINIDPLQSVNHMRIISKQRLIFREQGQLVPNLCVSLQQSFKGVADYACGLLQQLAQVGNLSTDALEAET
jgi:hypothetical protein